jgi:predicted ATP-grasp superfamily ATP-dependent carboligase
MEWATHTGESIVVPSVTAPSSISVIRSLGRRGIHTIAIADRETIPALCSRYCDEQVIAPLPSSDTVAYRDALLTLAAREDVRTIVPVREPDIYVLAKYREEFAAHIATPWPDFETLTRVHDRLELYRAARNAGVSVPETRLLDEVSDWDRHRIVKGRYALITPEFQQSLPAGTVQTPSGTIFLEPGVEPDIDAIIEKMGHVPIIQEYVPGTEYTYRGLFEDGMPLVTTLKQLRRGMKYSRGPSVYHESVSDPAAEAAGAALLSELGWTGLASVGFLQDSVTGEFKLLEINPRFWASLPMDIHAGADMPYYYWQFAAGELEPVDPASVKVGVASHFLRGEVNYLASVLRDEYPLVERPSFLREVWAVARSLVEQPHFDLLALDDPEPFVRDLFGAVVGLPEHLRTTPPAVDDRPERETTERPMHLSGQK